MIALNRVERAEKNASFHINVAGHYDDETLIDKNGKLIKIIALSGIDFVTADESLLDSYKNRLNHLLKSFSAEFALYTWTVRRQVSNFPEGEFEEGFAKLVNDKYQTQFGKKPLFCNFLYLAILTQPLQGILNQGINFFKNLNHQLDKEAKQNFLSKTHLELNEITQKLMSALADYQPRILGAVNQNHVLLSEPLSFISSLINFDSHPVPLAIQESAKLLCRKRLFFNRRMGVVEMRDAANGSKYCALLSLKEYAPATYQGMLNHLNTLKIEFVITQSFSFYEPHASKIKLRDQQKEMAQSRDESVSLIDELSSAFDNAASGKLSFGSHHFSLAVFADSIDELNQHIALLIAKFSEVNLTGVRETVASECAFWAQLPGNFSYIARASDISTQNFAALTGFHNYALGKAQDNFWGPAVTIFETLSGSPYYFNLHDKDVGNFLVYGTMGSGKTVLIGFIILQSMKFGGKRIIFDKDRGLEILVRAMDGVYERLLPGNPTGFNPCLLEDTIGNRNFLRLLFCKMLEIQNENLSASDEGVVSDAVAGLYSLHPLERRLSHVAPFFGTKKPGSLRERFDLWVGKGPNAWVFDNEMDNLNLNPDVLGFDVGDILKDETGAKTPALMYLTYRVSKAIEGQRGILFCDEGWQLLKDPYFRELINDWSRTPRKKNNVFGLATQSANDTASFELSKSINESAFCKIFFPNSNADKKVYLEDFGLSEHEFQMIRTLPDDERYFLLHHGKGTHKESVVARLNLQGLEDEMAVISARESTLLLLDQLLAEVGPDPKLWLPLFHQRRKGISS